MNRIILCNEWGAKPPAHPITPAPGRPDKILFHHTAGHHVEIEGPTTESVEEAKRYARDIQAFHMGVNRGWNDSGHNFLVCRNGVILEGRHGTVDALTKGRMVISAHCPGQNDQPGIEHEHLNETGMSDAQRKATLWLHVWICQHTRIRPTEIYGHGDFYATDCPAGLRHEILPLRTAVAVELARNPYSQIKSEMWRWFLWRDRGGIAEERPLARVRAHVPAPWWTRYQVHRFGRA